MLERLSPLGFQLPSLKQQNPREGGAPGYQRAHILSPLKEGTKKIKKWYIIFFARYFQYYYLTWRHKELRSCIICLQRLVKCAYNESKRRSENSLHRLCLPCPMSEIPCVPLFPLCLIRDKLIEDLGNKYCLNSIPEAVFHTMSRQSLRLSMFNF